MKALVDPDSYPEFRLAEGKSKITQLLLSQEPDNNFMESSDEAFLEWDKKLQLERTDR